MQRAELECTFELQCCPTDRECRLKSMSVYTKYMFPKHPACPFDNGIESVNILHFQSSIFSCFVMT